MRQPVRPLDNSSSRARKSALIRLLHLCAGGVLLTFFSAATLAQETVGNDSTVVYAASYFEQYAPINAQDMIDRIPGVGSATGGGGGGGFSGNPGGGGGGRGLGSGSGGSQTLINGKRTAGKNNQTRDLLGSISADQVDYIEIIRGTSGELDVRGSDQVVNVVLFGEADNSNISYELNADHYDDKKIQPGGSASYSGQLLGVGIVLSAAAEPRHDYRLSKESSVLGDFSPNDEVREERTRDQTSYNFSANLGYEINSKSSIRLNGLYGENDDPTKVLRWTTDSRSNPNTVELQRERIPGERDNWELGADYEYLADSGNRFKVLFISNADAQASTRERFDVAQNGTEIKNLFLDSASVLRERIVRSSYTMDLFESQSVEFGLERAQTILDSSLALGQLDSDGIPSAAYGGLVPQQVSNANSTVEEIRYEPFVIHNWEINRRMSLESTLIYETSEITQSGDLFRQRDFDFWKPKLDLRIDLTPTLQIRGSIEKEVQQLSFSDFTASTDNQDNDSNTQAGNANLTQEWLWRYEVNAEYRLPNDVGVIDGGVFYHQHHDRIARIDVSPSEDDLQSANGNIGDGKMYGLNLNASIRMSIINMPNLLVTSHFNIQDSSINDPFTGQDRRFTFYNRGRFSLGFRHDVPRLNMNYGMEWNNRFDGNMKRYDIDDLEVQSGDPMWTGFVEFIDSRGISYRFDARNITSGLQCRERQRFVGRLSAGILEEVEDQCAGSGRVISLKINGNF